MRALVVGGSGFVGSHVAEAYAAAGHDVRALGRRPPSELLSGVEYVSGDLVENGLAAEALAGVDVAVYALSTSTPASADKDPVHDATTNLRAALNFLASAASSSIEHMVLVSSGGTVYGVPERLPISEDAATRPISAYGVTRLAIEQHFLARAATGGLRVTVLRVGNAYGERQDFTKLQGASAAFLLCLLRGKPIEVWGKGDVVRDYVYAGDVGRACVLAAQDPPVSPIVNIGSGVGTSLVQLIELCTSVTGRPATVVNSPARPFDVSEIVLDVRRAAAELGWQPQVSLEEGLRRETDWLRALVAEPTAKGA